MTSVLSVLVAVIIGVLLWLALVDRGRRGGRLSAEATRLQLQYRPYASLSERLRNAHFMLLDCGQFRHFRHLIEGQLADGRYLNLFDYSLITAHGVSTQTLLLLPLSAARSGTFLHQPSGLAGRTASAKPCNTRCNLCAKNNGRACTSGSCSAQPAQLWSLLQPGSVTGYWRILTFTSNGPMASCCCAGPNICWNPEQLEAAIHHALRSDPAVAPADRSAAKWRTELCYSPSLQGTTMLLSRVLRSPYCCSLSGCTASQQGRPAAQSHRDWPPTGQK